jgi:hypothetical protein
MAQYRLQAINQCLKAIGESPVNSPQSGVPDAASASLVIDQITREVLSKGWSVNTAFAQRLVPDQDGIIKIASTVLKVDSTGRDRHIHVTVNQDVDGLDKLFDIRKQSFIFTSPILVDLVHYFDIDGLPFPIQDYIAARSARVFQEAEMGSISLDSFTSRREAEAWTALLDYEAEQEDNNVLTDSAYMREITGRNNKLSWR